MANIPTIAEAMTPFPHTIGAADSLLRAEELMSELRVRHLPVVDNEGELAGVLTDRDLKMALTSLRARSEDLLVSDAFVPEPYVVEPTEPLDRVLTSMATRHVGSALVAKEGKLVGIFTSTDACRSYAEHLRSH